MPRPKHQSRRRASAWRPLVFTVPIAILTLGALVFAAGPSEVLNTVSQGLNLTHRAKPVRPCNWWTCHKPKPVPSGRGSTSPAPAPAPTQPTTPTPTANADADRQCAGVAGRSSGVVDDAPADPPPSAPGTTPKAPPVTVCANSNLLSGPDSLTNCRCQSSDMNESRSPTSLERHLREDAQQPLITSPHTLPRCPLRRHCSHPNALCWCPTQRRLQRIIRGRNCPGPDVRRTWRQG